MATQDNYDDDASLASPTNATEDPPPYLSPETAAHIKAIEDIAYRLHSYREGLNAITYALPCGRDLHEIEDARRDLALMFPSTDVPQETRIAEAHTWILEHNKWLAEVKRRYGCAMHELTIPLLVDFRGACDLTALGGLFKHETHVSAKMKEEAASAIHRAAASKLDSKTTSEKALNVLHLRRTEDSIRAAIVCCTAAGIAYLYGTGISYLCGHRGQEFSEQSGFIISGMAARTVASSALYTVMYHLRTAETSCQNDATKAIEQAVRALAVCLTAFPTFERAWDKGIATRRDNLKKDAEPERLAQQKELERYKRLASQKYLAKERYCPQSRCDPEQPKRSKWRNWKNFRQWIGHNVFRVFPTR